MIYVKAREVGREINAELLPEAFVLLDRMLPLEVVELSSEKESLRRELEAAL